MIRYKRTKEENLESFVKEAKPSASQIARFAYSNMCEVSGVMYFSDSYDYINNQYQPIKK